MRIYLDNAATTKMSEVAIKAMIPYMNEIYGNPSSLHSVGQEANEALQNARERIAKLLGCEPKEITFTSGGSEADNQAIISAARFGERKGKKHIISTAFEHHAVLHTLEKLEKQGFEVTILDVHENGLISAEQVRNAIRDDTCLVTVMYANNEIGTIQPIAEIGAVCRERACSSTPTRYRRSGICISTSKSKISICCLCLHTSFTARRASVYYIREKVSR